MSNYIPDEMGHCMCGNCHECCPDMCECILGYAENDGDIDIFTDPALLDDYSHGEGTTVFNWCPLCGRCLMPDDSRKILPITTNNSAVAHEEE